MVSFALATPPHFLSRIEMNVPTSALSPSLPPDLVRDVAKRRTFAIISHPDAGKTTLTEKLLLFGGAIQMAVLNFLS